MRYRSVHTIEPGHVGRRATIRRRTPEGLSDVVGVLEAVDATLVKIRARDGTLHVIARDEIAAARVHDAPRPAPPGDPP